MSREWKPGDVAMVAADNRPKPYRAYYDGTTWREYDARIFCVDQPTSIRPLVVIDPEDESTLRQLGDLLVSEDRGYDEDSWQDLQAALREFATPKPPEPTGLGAVVEDAEGNLWVRAERVALAYMHWVSADRPTRCAKWSGIAAVRVLSEGVQP